MPRKVKKPFSWRRREPGHHEDAAGHHDGKQLGDDVKKEEVDCTGQKERRQGRNPEEDGGLAELRSAGIHASLHGRFWNQEHKPSCRRDVTILLQDGQIIYKV
jgi:hypothetical protein